MRQLQRCQKLHQLRRPGDQPSSDVVGTTGPTSRVATNGFLRCNYHESAVMAKIGVSGIAPVWMSLWRPASFPLFDENWHQCNHYPNDGQMKHCRAQRNPHVFPQRCFRIIPRRETKSGIVEWWDMTTCNLANHWSSRRAHSRSCFSHFY